MKLESLKNDLFAPMSTSEAAMIQGGMAEATSRTIWANTFSVHDGIAYMDKATFPDDDTAEPVAGVAP